MSPGTRSAIGISWGRGIPARSTAVVELTMALSSSVALFERNSCQKRSSVLKSTIALRTMIVRSERSSGAAKMTSEKKETVLTEVGMKELLVPRSGPFVRDFVEPVLLPTCFDLFLGQPTPRAFQPTERLLGSAYA